MTAVKVGLLLVALISMPFYVGCDSGGGAAAPVVEQTEMEKYAEENPESVNPSYEGID